MAFREKGPDAHTSLIRNGPTLAAIILVSMALAGCIDDIGKDAATEAVVPIIAIENEMNYEVRLKVQLRSGPIDIVSNQVYTVPPRGEILTPPASMDLPCDQTVDRLQMETYSETGASLSTRNDPVACNGERLYIGIFAGDAVPRAMVWTTPMPEGWQRGDPWPDMGDDDWREDPEPEAPPSMSFSKNSGQRTITVVQAPNNIAWTDIAVTGSAGCQKPSGTVQAGDQLSCGTGSVTFTWSPTGDTLYQTTF